ncbi:MAG: LysR family transcriptional regulator [Hyphomicrobiaceae bacterium]
MFIRQMTYLIALAREKHFARAAEACHVTQSTLSAGIKSLERELDMRLVVREPRFSGLTAEGERVAEWALQIIADYDSLKQDADLYRKGLKGILRLGVVPAAMPTIAELTRPFSVKHSNVEIEVRSMASTEIQNGLDKFEIDAGITYLENEPLSRVRKTAIYRERYIFATSRNGLRSKSTSITWSDAARHRLCLLNEAMQNRRVLNNLADTIGLELNPTIVTNSFLAIFSHVKSGHYSSIVPHTFSYIFDGCENLILLDLIDPVHHQTIGVVTSDRTPLMPMARAFMDCATRIDFKMNRRICAPAG